MTSRVISDNGPQFIAKDFKEFIRICGMIPTYVGMRTSPYYPQNNGKLERWHRSVKGECIRRGTPLSLEVGSSVDGGVIDDHQPVKRKRATQECDPPGIAGRVYDGLSWGRSQPTAANPQRQFGVIPQATQNSSLGGRRRRV